MENSNMGKQRSTLTKADSKISSRETDPVVISKELYQQVIHLALGPKKLSSAFSSCMLLLVSFLPLIMRGRIEKSNNYQTV